MADPVTPTTKADPSTLQTLLTILAGAGSGVVSRLTSPSLTSQVPPELSQLLQQQTARSTYQNPLFEAASQQALAGLPTYAKQGHTLGSMAAPTAADSGGGGMSPAAAAALGAAGGGAANALGGNALGKLIEGLRKLLANRGRNTVQGNQPFSGGALTGPAAFDPSQFMGWGDPQQGPGLTPHVTTDYSFPDFPGLPSGDVGNGMSLGLPGDPSQGTGLGPGMQGYYGGSGGGLPDPSEE